ncbi:hypothetical protein [Cryptosporangium aurantiacum]|uniref:Uncharacterized protein n=1 Tax=Cryptosporangium aurantiacum TaxID=134849 RepID=A0A1M7REI5_9ACTN|nr:hypothetical protein [Cryptosporangium aurantiacum]SHN44693.1 hypothetical protein SAMN05443668_110327 [Cryptosporangium aurantiacum]
MSASVQESPQGWVPVEHRFLGLDRRQFKPALFVLVVGLVLIYGFQGLNALIPWDNATKAGDVLDLGRGATAVPPVGWQLEDGARVGESKSGVSATSVRTVLANGGAVIQLEGAKFTGTANAFLDQVLSVRDDDADIAGARASFTTDAGLVGVVQSESGPGGEDLLAAFKMATGDAATVEAAPALIVEVTAAPGEFERYQHQIDAFLRSITPETTK